MVDKIKPLKFENPALGGSELNYLPTEADPSEDFVTTKGISFENLDTYLLEKIGGIIKDTIPNYSYKPYITANQITAIEIFNGFTQTTPNRRVRIDLTYSGLDLTNESWKIYDPSDGTTILRTIALTHSWSGIDLTKTEVSES